MNIKNKLKIIKLSDIKPYKNNAKVHTQAQIELIKKSLEKNDYYSPLGVDKNNIIVIGHGRYEALKQLDPEQKLEVVDFSYLKPKEIKKLRILDNKIVGTEYDKDLLQAEIESLYKNLDDDMEKAMAELAIDEAELFKLMPTPETEGDDELPEKVKSITKKGDLWELGKHRVLCGDSTNETDVKKLLDNNKADMVFTDPPYNIDYQGVKDKREKIKNDKMPDEDFTEFLKKSLYKAGVIYVCCSWQYSHLFKKAMEERGVGPKAMIIWDKVNPAQNLDKYYKQHEIIYYHGKFGGQKTLRGDVWQLKRQRNTLHPTMKPVELIEMAINDNGACHSVYDSFLGSGSTLIACEKSNRVCYGMELSKKYCDVIVQRYRDFCEKNNLPCVVKRNGKIVK